MTPSEAPAPAHPQTSASTPVTYLVLAKAPVPGAVKTRLTTGYSEHEAAALAAAALLDTLDAVREAAASAAASAPLPVCALAGDLDDGAAPDAVRAALEGFGVIVQHGDGLGQRIAYAHLDAAGPDGATVQIGMDTPQLSAAALALAAARVADPDGPDAVLGPAADGGWWLLALRRAADARLVADVEMSTARTGALTRAALEDAGLAVELVETLVDVDEPHHVPQVAALAPGTRFAALAATFGPRTEVG